MYDLWALAGLTLKDPRAGMRGVLQINPPSGVRIMALALMAVASSLMMHLSLWLAPMPAPNPLIEMLVSTPFTTAIVQIVVLILASWLIFRVGKAWGGRGSFDDAVLTVVWLQVFLLALQAVQTLGLVLLPAVAVLIGPLSLVAFFWLQTQFVLEIHGFTSGAKVLLGIILTIFAVSFLAVFLILALFGPEALPRHV